MPKCFVIEDESHAEQIGEYASLDDAWAELGRLAAIPWDQRPNVAPCTSWQTCGRTYEIIEYETSSTPWQELRRVAGLDVSVNGVAWGSEAPRYGARQFIQAEPVSRVGSIQAISLMKSVFVVQHVHVFGPGEEDVKMIGVYSTKDSALAAVARLKIHPGFCDLPLVVEPGGDDWAGFHITEYSLDEDSWTEGYVTV